MPGCGKEITQNVPTKYSYRQVPAKCGQIGIYGDPIFCDDCEGKYSDRNWEKEAIENGERYNEDS
jgi:hypothetical protein